MGLYTESEGLIHGGAHMPSYGLSVIYGWLIHGELIFGWASNSRRRAFARNVEILLIFFSELHPYHAVYVISLTILAAT
jgi:hypothetical protein